jgi:hypothetical protein
MTKFIICIALAAMLAVPATATARPRLSLTLPPQGADAGQPIAYQWSVATSRPGSVVLQRQTGTARVWRTVARLEGSSGSGRLPALALGSYKLRIANIGPKPRRKLWAQQVRTLRVFGDVPLGKLLASGERGVFNAPTATFPYVDALTVDHGSTRGRRDTFSTNTCRSVRISFSGAYVSFLSDGDDISQLGVTAQVTQETRDPVTASAPLGAIASLNATLVPGQSWSIGASVYGTSNLADFEYGSLRAYLNGTASCYGGASAD